MAGARAEDRGPAVSPEHSGHGAREQPGRPTSRPAGRTAKPPGPGARCPLNAAARCGTRGRTAPGGQAASGADGPRLRAPQPGAVTNQAPADLHRTRKRAQCRLRHARPVPLPVDEEGTVFRQGRLRDDRVVPRDVAVGLNRQPHRCHQVRLDLAGYVRVVTHWPAVSRPHDCLHAASGPSRIPIPRLALRPRHLAMASRQRPGIQLHVPAADEPGGARGLAGQAADRVEVRAAGSSRHRGSLPARASHGTRRPRRPGAPRP